MADHRAHSSDKSTKQAKDGVHKSDKGTPGYKGAHRAEAGHDDKGTGSREGRGRVAGYVKRDGQ